MDDFKNSTRTKYDTGCGYAKGGSAKVGKVMHEFGAGKLHSGSKKGPAVSNPKQAIAIALSEARKAGAAIPVKKAGGGRAMTEMERRMSEEDVTRGFDTKPPVSRKIINAKAAAPKREPMIVAKKTTVAVVPKNANPIERLLAVKSGAPLKKGGPAAYKMGGKVMRKADGGNVVGAPSPTDMQAQQAYAANAAKQLSTSPPPPGVQNILGAVNAASRTVGGPNVSTQSVATQRQVSGGPVMGAANTFMPTQSGGDFNESGGRMQAVMPSPVLGNPRMANRQERMQDRMQDRMERRSQMDERMQGMQDMMSQRRQARFGPPATQGVPQVASPTARPRINIASPSPVGVDEPAPYMPVIKALPSPRQVGRAPTSPNADPTNPINPTNPSNAATNPTMWRAYKRGGDIKSAKAPMSKKQLGGLASPVRTSPSLAQRDQTFVADKAVPMREMVGRANYKKGGKPKC